MFSTSTRRALLAAATLALCALWATPARAQFSNHSIGFEAGGVYIPSPGISSGGALGLDSTLYMESGVELYFRILVGIHHVNGLSLCQTDTEPNRNACNVVGLMPAFGFRYLFIEDNIRPYLGLNVAYEAYFTTNYISRFSISPMAGIEFFVSDNFSIGLQVEYHMLLALNSTPDYDWLEHGVVGLVKVGWYF